MKIDWTMVDKMIRPPVREIFVCSTCDNIMWDPGKCPECKKPLEKIVRPPRVKLALVPGLLD